MERDTNSATQAVEADPRVDAFERDIEQFVIRLITMRQPMAGDFRPDHWRAQGQQQPGAYSATTLPT